MTQWVANLPVMQIRVRCLGQEDPLYLGNPLWYSCLGNLMDRGAWQAAVHRKRPKQLSTHAQYLVHIIFLTKVDNCHS